MKIVKPLVTVVAAVKVNFVAVDCCSMIISAGWFWSKGFRLASTNQIVQIKNIKIIKCFLPVPTAKNIEKVSHLVTRVSSSATRWIILRERSIPSHSLNNK